MQKTTFITAGDAFITKRLPEGGYEGFQELSSCIQSHDVRFLNLESTFHETEGYPAAESGGTWAMSDPRTLDDMKVYGFNIFNTGKNAMLTPMAGPAHNRRYDFGEEVLVNGVKLYAGCVLDLLG